MDANSAFGFLAGAAGLFDLLYVYLRRGTLPLRVRNLRIFGATLMFMVSAAILFKFVKLG